MLRNVTSCTSPSTSPPPPLSPPADASSSSPPPPHAARRAAALTAAREDRHRRWRLTGRRVVRVIGLYFERSGRRGRGSARALRAGTGDEVGHGGRPAVCS